MKVDSLESRMTQLVPKFSPVLSPELRTSSVESCDLSFECSNSSFEMRKSNNLSFD